MRIANDFQRYEAERQIYSVLVMHFQEGITQAEIAKLTNLSHAKVNRLIKQGRETGHGRDQHPQPVPGALRPRGALPEATGLETVRITPDRVGQSADDPAAGRRRRREPAARDRPGRRHGLHHRRQGRQRRRRGAEPRPRLRGRGRAGHRLRAGQALHRRQPRRDADGRQARRPGLPDPCAALRRQRRRAATC